MKKNLSDLVYDGVVQDIVKGKFQSESVLNEKDLIQKYGVSRSPIREALARLCNDGVLINLPRFGYKVRPIDKEYLDQIIQLRLVLEVSYFDSYFASFTEGDLLHLEKSIPTLSGDMVKTPIDFWQLTSGFHLSLAECYQDRYFYETLKRVLNNQLLTFSAYYWSSWSKVVTGKMEDQHSYILRAIRKKDKETAIFLLREDIKSF
ncbi:MAG: GntR family transcriptional regulator [Peptoniphilaceae bacterium]|nr:GntR family transcriptional regulator [Peptoniphilaceae bacterium]MDY3076436.1 GntR family transcriptional regulator [Peptoniphilaceae bacterium]